MDTVITFSLGIVAGMVLCALLDGIRNRSRNVDHLASERTVMIMAAREAAAHKAARAEARAQMTDVEMAAWAEFNGRVN